MKSRRVSFPVPPGVYSEDAVRIAAQVFASRAEVYLEKGAKTAAVELAVLRKDADKDALSRLAGEFLNELLNQEYRFLVGSFNRKISNLIVTQALLSARGDESRPAAPPEEETPEFKAAVAKMMEEARAEIARSMPKKLPPQGAPLPPAENV